MLWYYQRSIADVGCIHTKLLKRNQYPGYRKFRKCPFVIATLRKFVKANCQL